jgi:hypothetical protein
VQIDIRPDDATVYINDRKLSRPATSQDIGCGAAVVTAKHPRYADAVERVELTPGKAATVELRLQRPRHQMTITSSPAGATVKIGPRTVGKTPVTTSVIGFEKAKITMSLAGHQTWSKRVYSRYGKQRVFARLRPAASKPKRSTARRTRPK